MYATIDFVEAGALLRRTRESHGWGNRRAFAERIGIPESTIRKYEDGKGSRPDIARLTRIAQAFGARDGAKVLYAYGADAVAQRLASSDTEPVEIDLTTPPEFESLTDRVDRIERTLADLLEYVQNYAKPDLVSTRPRVIRPVAA